MGNTKCGCSSFPLGFPFKSPNQSRVFQQRNPQGTVGFVFGITKPEDMSTKHQGRSFSVLSLKQQKAKSSVSLGFLWVPLVSPGFPFLHSQTKNPRSHTFPSRRLEAQPRSSPGSYESRVRGPQTTLGGRRLSSPSGKPLRSGHLKGLARGD